MSSVARAALRSERGFTLAEILVALAIASLALTMLFQIFSSGLNSVSRARNVIDATLLAKSQLAVVGRSERVEEGEATGTTEDGYRWVTRITPFVDDRPDPDSIEGFSVPSIYEVSVTVMWGEGSRARDVTLATLRLGPALE